MNEIVPKAERNLGGSAPSLAVWHSITRNTIGFHEALLINRNDEERIAEPNSDSVEGSGAANFRMPSQNFGRCVKGLPYQTSATFFDF